MASKRKSKGFAPKEAQETFAGAVQKARQPIGPVEEHEIPPRVDVSAQKGRRKNNADNQFVKRNAQQP